MNRPFAFAQSILLLGIAMLFIAIALAVRTYMPCPFWDEWAFVNAIADGAGATSWSWLWSQHNEHRLLMTRLLILLDIRAFGGRNVSLFIEMFAAQILQWAAICHVLARYTTYSRALKLALAGIFAFCLFHLNQAENFTWAFQASFVIAFCIGTFALLGIAFFERWRWPMLAAIAVGLAPFVAALNVSGGLLIGPVAIGFALLRRLRIRYVLVIAVLFALSTIAYLAGYRVPFSRLTPVEALAHPKDLFVYVLTYFGASWTKLLPHKERLTSFIWFIVLGTLIYKAARNRRATSTFEWFCVAECALMIAMSAVTALGRLQFGVGQAYAGRYQTPAMLYWASLCALFLIAARRYWPARALAAEGGTLLILVAFATTCLPIWRSQVSRSDSLARACYTAMHGNADDHAAKLLYGGTRADLQPGVDYLKRLWTQLEVRERNREYK